MALRWNIKSILNFNKLLETFTSSLAEICLVQTYFRRIQYMIKKILKVVKGFMKKNYATY